MVTDAPHESSSRAANSAGAFLEAHARRMSERMPAFALGWLTMALVWAAVLVGKGHLGPRGASVWLGAQAVLLVAAWALSRRTRSARRVREIALAAPVLVGWTVLALFTRVEPSSEILGFLLVSLYALAAILFAWGWGAELALIAATTIPAPLVLPLGAPHVQLLELAAELGLGALLTLTAAEGGWRSLQHTWLSRQQEAERTRELNASRDAYRDLAENARDLIWTTDRAGTWTYVNDALARFLGRPASTVIGHPMRDFQTAHPANPDVAALIARIAAGETLPPERGQVSTAAGPRWVETLASGIFGPDGSLVGVRGISRDITERVAAEERLRESEAKFRTLAETVAVAVFIAQGTRLRYVNPTGVAITGYAPEEHFAMNFWEILHPDERELARARGMARQRGEPVPRNVEYRIITKSGELRWVDFSAVSVEFEGAPAFLGTAVDITARKRIEQALRASLEELQRSREQLRMLAQRQTLVREEERKRLGLDLHDGVCQELIGVGILLESIRCRLEHERPDAAKDLAHALGYVNGIAEHLRLLARDLRPTLLVDVGLEGSLRALAAAMTTPERPVVARVVTPVPRLAEETEVAVYRIAQEALANAVRHADAQCIALSLLVTGGTLELEVRDDGRGFALETTSSRALGLVSMRERALAVGGALEIESGPGRGTTVRLRCPVVERPPASMA